MGTATSHHIPDEVETIDWSAAAEQCGGDESFLKEMLEIMHVEIKSYTVNLRHAVVANEMDSTRQIAHAIKGVATNLMCHRLRSIALHVETMAKWGIWLDRDSVDVKHSKEDLEKSMCVLEKELQAVEVEICKHYTT
ncbi:unnamed protein product [Ectocarpus sp. 6 AP-2014]